MKHTIELTSRELLDIDRAVQYMHLRMASHRLPKNPSSYEDRLLAIRLKVEDAIGEGL